MVKNGLHKTTLSLREKEDWKAFCKVVADSDRLAHFIRTVELHTHQSLEDTENEVKELIKKRLTGLSLLASSDAVLNAYNRLLIYIIQLSSQAGIKKITRKEVHNMLYDF